MTTYDHEIALLRKDAARYRWLEAKCGANGSLIVASVSEFGIDPWSGDDLTGKIDAEMAKYEGQASTLYAGATK